MVKQISSEKQDVLLRLDPRTKLYMLLTFNVVMLTSLTEGIAIYLKPALAVLAFLFLLNARKPKPAVIYIILYAVLLQAEVLLPYISGIGILSFIVRFSAQIITRMVPGAMFAYYVISTTKVSEFVAAMERLHITEKFIIPFAVMFRFFPTIADEYHSIQDAMKMRGIGIRKGPAAMLEYRLIPLIVSIVKIGDELSAASVTRGLGSATKRTNYCNIGLGLPDFIFILVMTAAVVAFIIF